MEHIAWSDSVSKFTLKFTLNFVEDVAQMPSDIIGNVSVDRTNTTVSSGQTVVAKGQIH